MNLPNTNLDTIRTLVSNLGCSQVDAYCLGVNCLNALESLEKELLEEDVVCREVRICLGDCDVIKNDLIPIIVHIKDFKILIAAIRLLVNLTLPTEYLLPLENVTTSSQIQEARKRLLKLSFATKKAFLNADSTLSVVNMLRETIIKSEKYQYHLEENHCVHLKNCVLLLRNILYFPDEADTFDKSIDNAYPSDIPIAEWQSVQNKLIWNLFVQGLGGALLLMLNSKHKDHWTVPLALVIALLYRNQNMYKVHQALQLVSSPSDSSGDDEGSDGSKHSSISMSSEPTKNCNRLSDSGCPQSSDAYSTSTSRKASQFLSIPHSSGDLTSDCCSSDMRTKFEEVRISEDTKIYSNCKTSTSSVECDGAKSKLRHVGDYDSNDCDDVFMRNDSGISSSSGYHHRKKLKSNCCVRESAMSDEDSAVSDCSFADPGQEKSHDNSGTHKDNRQQKNLEAVHKLRCTNANILESDSSNEDNQKTKSKLRCHPPSCWRGKSPRRNSSCNPSICMEAAFAASCTKSRIRYPLWEKRNSVSKLVDQYSLVPSEDDISNLLKEFTLSFMHSGYSKLIIDIKCLLLRGPSMAIDKSLFFWLVTYFLHLASTLNLTLDHLNTILTIDIVSYLIYENVGAYENVQLHCNKNERIARYALRHLNLSVTALKEVIAAIDFYSRKPSLKDKAFFTELYGKLAGLQDLRQLPLLLLQNYNPFTHTKKYLEDVIILNHQILVMMERGFEECWLPNRINISSHIKQFATGNIINCYSKVLDDFKSNSEILNDCVFTMMHHVAGDIHASQLLFQPTILKTFSGILQEDLVLEQYQEDLIMYILNRFSQQVKKRNMKRSAESFNNSSEESDDASSDSSNFSCDYLLSEDDDLFWWYLQFEQDEDPVTRISEHVLTSKQDILQKLQLKGIISQEKYEQLEEKMEDNLVPENKLQDENIMHFTNNFDDDITNLLRTLVHLGHRHHVTWLQDALLETCYVKLGLEKHVVEPVTFNSIKTMSSIPLVPYTEEQASILQDDVFLQLLKKLGLHLTANSLMYPRIPMFWSPDLLFTIAARLGPIRKDKLKFTYEDLMLANPNRDETPTENFFPFLPPLSSCSTLSSWLTAVQLSKENYRSMNIMDVDESASHKDF